MYMIDVKDAREHDAIVGLPVRAINEIGNDLILEIISKLAQGDRIALESEEMSLMMDIMNEALEKLIEKDKNGWGGIDRCRVILK